VTAPETLHNESGITQREFFVIVKKVTVEPPYEDGHSVEVARVIEETTGEPAEFTLHGEEVVEGHRARVVATTTYHPTSGGSMTNYKLFPVSEPPQSVQP
jgi:hypothetical protein